MQQWNSNNVIDEVKVGVDREKKKGKKKNGENRAKRRRLIERLVSSLSCSYNHRKCSWKNQFPEEKPNKERKGKIGKAPLLGFCSNGGTLRSYTLDASGCSTDPTLPMETPPRFSITPSRRRTWPGACNLSLSFFASKALASIRFKLEIEAEFLD